MFRIMNIGHRVKLNFEEEQKTAQKQRCGYAQRFWFLVFLSSGA